MGHRVTPPPDISGLLSQAQRAKTLRGVAQKRLDDVILEIKDLDTESEQLDLVSALFRDLIDQEILDGVSAVESLQTEGLQTVFDDQDLQVKADVEVKRGRVSVLLKTVQQQTDGTIIEGMSRDSFGGSVTTVQSVIMRIMITLKHGLRPLLLLDESLPAFDHNYVVNMAKFLQTLCEEFGLDMLLVTHNPILHEYADKSYRIRKTTTKGAKFIEDSRED